MSVAPSGSTFTKMLSQLVANQSNITYALTNDTNSNITVLETNVAAMSSLLSDLGFVYGDELATTASGSSFTAVFSQLVADSSNTNALAANLSSFFSDLGFVYGDEGTTTASASTFTAVFSQICADASNANTLASDISALFSDIGFVQGDRLQTAPSTSTFTAVFSQLVANYSNMEADVSDLRLNHALWDDKYASDAWANVSDLKVTVSDLAELIFGTFG